MKKMLMHDYVTLSMKDQGDKIFSGFNLFVPYKIRIMYLRHLQDLGSKNLVDLIEVIWPCYC